MFRACSATGKNLDKLHDCSGPLWSDFSNDNVHPSSNPNFRCNLKLMLLSSPSLALLENRSLQQLVVWVGNLLLLTSIVPGICNPFKIVAGGGRRGRRGRILSTHLWFPASLGSSVECGDSFTYPWSDTTVVPHKGQPLPAPSKSTLQHSLWRMSMWCGGNFLCFYPHWAPLPFLFIRCLRWSCPPPQVLAQSVTCALYCESLRSQSAEQDKLAWRMPRVGDQVLFQQGYSLLWLIQYSFS